MLTTRYTERSIGVYPESARCCDDAANRSRREIGSIDGRRTADMGNDRTIDFEWSKPFWRRV